MKERMFLFVAHDISFLPYDTSLRMIMPLSNHTANHWLMKHIFLTFASEPIKKCLSCTKATLMSYLYWNKIFKVQSKLLVMKPSETNFFFFECTFIFSAYI